VSVMRNRLKTKLADIIVSGLQRKTLTLCSKWAEKCRVMGPPLPGPWTFKYHPWLREMHDSEAECNVGMKSAQGGFTETALNRVFYKMDIKRSDCLYVLPAKNPDASDFSSSRFDGALELSPYLQNLFSDVKNVGHKRSGSVNMYIRGSRSRSGLKSIPTGTVIVDELDEMVQENISLVTERMSGQIEKQLWMISTPTVERYGIHAEFLKSTQEHFFFKCPHCSKTTELIFPDCLEITSDNPNDLVIKNTRLLCKECKGTLEHEQKPFFLANGIWIPQITNTDVRGFHINQLYSYTVKPWEFARKYLLGQSNPSDEQEFFNSKMGLPHQVKDSQITDVEIDNCTRKYASGDKPPPVQIVTIGVDVGKKINYVVSGWIVTNTMTPDINYSCKERVIEYGTVDNFEDIDSVITKWRPQCVVCDANPERRKAFELAQRFWGLVHLCFYGNNINGKYIHQGENELEQTVTVDRTSWLDLVVSRFFSQSIELPPTDLDFRNQIKSVVRVPKIDANGNPVNKYIDRGPDHYMHALNYSEVALAISTKIGGTKNIRSPR